MPDFIAVTTDEEYAIAASLFNEYANWLGIDLSFQKFDEELQSLKLMYGPDKGIIIICKQDSDYMACIAVRPIDAETAEFKRMYVKSAFREMGIGQVLLEKAIEFAKLSGYQTIKLDTLNTMTPAMNLYKKNGFYEIPAYYFNPEKTAVYFEKKI